MFVLSSIGTLAGYIPKRFTKIVSEMRHRKHKAYPRAANVAEVAGDIKSSSTCPLGRVPRIVGLPTSLLDLGDQAASKQLGELRLHGSLRVATQLIAASTATAFSRHLIDGDETNRTAGRKDGDASLIIEDVEDKHSLEEGEISDEQDRIFDFASVNGSRNNSFLSTKVSRNASFDIMDLEHSPTENRPLAVVDEDCVSIASDTASVNSEAEQAGALLRSVLQDSLELVFVQRHLFLYDRALVIADAALEIKPQSPPTSDVDAKTLPRADSGELVCHFRHLMQLDQMAILVRIHLILFFCQTHGLSPFIILFDIFKIQNNSFWLPVNNRLTLTLPLNGYVEAPPLSDSPTSY
ncbi:unnamed protein product [Protopolystoma xenopodis]|uniref:Uncharacterized protein n=1 Tax=Protopolystoma xenopodis TaxID=117903 RepID=A0A3S5FFL4_9PLAT|nr:unnamed protein product [Protopolystoma xenopodis]